MTTDIEQLYQAIHHTLDKEEIIALLELAIELIEPEQRPQLLEGFLALNTSQPKEPTAQALLKTVEEFRDSSLAGVYYEAFRVNSRNFMDMSEGTTNWIDEFNQLIDLCIQQCQDGECHQTQRSFKILFELLDEIDTGSDIIVFFADEAGSWQVGVDWEEVLPCYFAALAALAKSKPFAQDVMHLVTNHVEHDRDRFLQIALKLAKPSQKKALKALM